MYRTGTLAVRASQRSVRMGVKGLWQLLLPIGRRISLETIEGQRIAIDASIWLTQFLKVYQHLEQVDEYQQERSTTAHLLSLLFRRLCRLQYHGIKGVFVFDGATPEIKKRELAARRRRREQFGGDGDENIKRLARKILSETLQKAKRQKTLDENEKRRGSQSTRGVAHAQGFNPGSEAEYQEAVDQTDLGTAVTKRSGDQNDRVGNLDLNDNDLTEPQRKSDWGAQLESGEDEPSEDAASSSSENVEYEDFGINMKDITVKKIASLPSSKRKDAIEIAKRQQRLRSRNEFMPAAGHPNQFSQVQLKNFLRSCRLNKSIVDMATEAAAHDSVGQPGETMASDSSTRVILIRESDTMSNKKLREKESRLPRRRNHSLLFGDDESDSSSDDNKDPLRKKQTTVEEDDSEDVSIDDQHVSETSSAFANGRRVVEYADHMSMSEPELTCNNFDSLCEGGFMPAGKSAPLRTKSDQELAQEVADQDLAAAVQREEEHHQPGRMSVDTDSPRRTRDDCGDEALLSGHGIGNVNHFEPTSTTEKPLGVPTSRYNKLDSTDTSLRSHLDQSEEEDDIDWQDVSDGSPNLPICDTCSEPISAKRGGPVGMPPDSTGDPSDELATRSSKLSESVGNRSIDIEEANEDEMRSSADKKSSVSKESSWNAENAAAIERAQATASNLANWAGRMFRRAVYEMKETSDGTKPTATQKPISAAITPFSNVAAQVETLKSASKRIYTDDETLPAADDVPASNVLRPVQGKEQLLEFNATDMQSDLKRKEREMALVSDEMHHEVIRLLQLFGIPFLEAPSEAEAQCVELEKLGLVDAVNSEDSDVFVFGGRTVYKNIFDEMKYVEVYKAADAEQEMGLGRSQMIALAMLLGGDYTEGVKGVGIVNAMEVLAAYDVSDDLCGTLTRFRRWLDGFDDVLRTDHCDPLSTAEKHFRAEHGNARSRWVAPGSFPSEAVASAYRSPVVDNSNGRFSWGSPDIEGLLQFCERSIGWTNEETMKHLRPIVERKSDGFRQTRLDSRMKYSDSIKVAQVRSKRLQQALKGIKNCRENQGKTTAINR